MKRILVAAAACAALGLTARAAAPLPPPANAPEQAPPRCDTRDSADYVPGVDAQGRPVAPADVPTASDLVVSTEVYPELRSRTPQLRGTGLAVRIDGLGQPPPCRPLPPSPDKSR